jgi:hypothetical protein
VCADITYTHSHSHTCMHLGWRKHAPVGPSPPHPPTYPPTRCRPILHVVAPVQVLPTALALRHFPRRPMLLLLLLLLAAGSAATHPFLPLLIGSDWLSVETWMRSHSAAAASQLSGPCPAAGRDPYRVRKRVRVCVSEKCGYVSTGSNNRLIDTCTAGTHTANRSIEPVRMCPSTQPATAARIEKLASPSPRSSPRRSSAVLLSVGCHHAEPTSDNNTHVCWCGMGGWISSPPILPPNCNRVAGACLGALGVGVWLPSIPSNQRAMGGR